MLLGYDTETTGLDPHHGSRAYLVTLSSTDGEGEIDTVYYEWNVDPETRMPAVDPNDLQEIQVAFDKADRYLAHNTKFDLTFLNLAFEGEFRWDWSKCLDTVMAAHLVESNKPKDLTHLCMKWMHIDIDKYEQNIRKHTLKARVAAKRDYPNWDIAERDLPCMPSAKDKVWKYDMWLPRAIALQEKYPKDHPWWMALPDYANVDSEAMVLLYRVLYKEIKERNLEKIYRARLKHLEPTFYMEKAGVTISKPRLRTLKKRFVEDSKTKGDVCIGIAASMDHELSLPKSGMNNSLRDFTFNILKLETHKKTEAGLPSLDKDCVEHYLATLPRHSKQLSFIRNLGQKRKMDTAVSYMESYEKFWIHELGKTWYRLFPSLNLTGTDTLRCSSSNPNSQQISKQEGSNLRYCFGPAPGREWWSFDAKNIELRLPAYEAGEEAMVNLFENPDEPPYYGSNHLMIFDVLHPDKFKKYGADCKKEFASTWYQWTKNGNFAVQYGALEKSGTADRAYHVPGAQAIIQKRFKKVAELNQAMIRMANKCGYVETMPDRTVDPDRGYPLQCTRTEYGRILETVPLNYHIQGTAMQWMMKAMVRCHKIIQEYNEGKKPEFRVYIIMQVHDELVFDMPKSAVDPRTVKDWKTDKFNYLRTNLPLVKQIMKAMEQGGDDIGIPTPVGCEYHPRYWSEGLTVLGA